LFLQKADRESLEVGEISIGLLVGADYKTNQPEYAGALPSGVPESAVSSPKLFMRICFIKQ
jgi:hypothetical protein